MWKPLKDVLLWSYERGSWQYDVLCLLILAFLFLTPSRWFNKPEIPPASPAASSPRSDSARPTNAVLQGAQKDKSAAESRNSSSPPPR